LKTLSMLTEAEIKEDDYTSQRSLSFPERVSENRSAEILDDPSPKNIHDDVKLENHQDMNSTTSDITNDYVKKFLQDKIASQEFEMSEDKSELKLSGSSHPQTDIERSLCRVYSSMSRNIILMNCVVSTVYTVCSVFLALVKLAELENADYKVDEFDNKPVHKLQEDLSHKSEECGAKLIYLVDAIHTDQVPGMLDVEERRTCFNHRLACSRINNLTYLKMIPLVIDDPDDPRKLMLVRVPELLGNLVLVSVPELLAVWSAGPGPPTTWGAATTQEIITENLVLSAAPATFRTCGGCPQRGGGSCAARPAPAPRSTSTSLPENL